MRLSLIDAGNPCKFPTPGTMRGGMAASVSVFVIPGSDPAPLPKPTQKREHASLFVPPEAARLTPRRTAQLKPAPFAPVRQVYSYA